jgi:dTDP-4-dehydrorhamnose reductase
MPNTLIIMRIIMQNKLVLVTGAKGQLGSEINELIHGYSQYDFLFVDVEELDLSQHKYIVDFLQEKQPDIIINCAAYTAVDKAEEEEELAEKVNHLAIKSIAEIAKEKNISVIHVSTDYVFNGKNFKPYSEDDQTNPNAIYGSSKLNGEKALLAINPSNSIIIRTAWVYSSFGNNFIKTMMRLGRDKTELSVVYDQIGSPTYARDLAKAILDILPAIKNDQVEIYHYTDEGICSWYDLAVAIMSISELNCKITPIESKDYPTPATRPHYSVLNKAKIKENFQIDIPHWYESLCDCIKKIKAKG